MNECTLPTKRDIEMGARLVLKQSADWSWIHRPVEERQLSRQAKGRLALLRWHDSHGTNVSRTCRRFGISRPTFYYWHRRYQDNGLGGLEDRSHRPHQVARPTWTTSQVLAVLALREQYPRWGKAKLHCLLGAAGIDLSVSMVGRILRYLKDSGQLRQGKRRGVRTTARPRPYAMRKPKDYVVTAPGDLVQVDTKEIRFGNGCTFKHLSLVDDQSRYAAAEIGSRASARMVAAHLDRMLARLPFAVRAIQVDGGSEFKADFEAYCQHRNLRLFVLPPRSPKLNGKVERLQRTFDEECYHCLDGPLRVADLAAGVHAYEAIYNHVRPHHALGYRTPVQYLADLEVSA
ncbi:MAG: IS481 family transposase [Acidobacteriaceae bacterium]